MNVHNFSSGALKPSSHDFPCSLGEKAIDSMTGMTGTICAFLIYADGSKAVQLVCVDAQGHLHYEWIATSRVRAAT